MMIREITEADAAPFLKLCQTIDQETNFMLFEPNERDFTIEKQKSMIQALLSPHNSTLLVAEKDEQLVGYIIARGGAVKRKQHAAYLAIGLLQQYAGQGIGKQLLHEIEQWARKQQLLRLELTVMSHNERAIALYKKIGFVIEGEAAYGVIVDGQPRNEYYMAKIL
ncbi:N-acetyltransferase family protein [Bacillus sp. S14(2024)]|uniref:GNAT family N-acetyltransferase n=1 Tax=Bacillus sp. S14(2024) TaxID=3162884 RepID=UPI003D2130E1